MGKDLIPELHDVLKLTAFKHNFSDFNLIKFEEYIPKTRTWEGIYQHHCEKGFPDFPKDRETFLLCMADGLAANFSRHEYTRKGIMDFTIHKLWNSNAVKDDRRLKTEEEIKLLLEFLSADPTFKNFTDHDQYEYILKTRPEDASSGKNITSLYTHLVLTGKFYRFLKMSSALQLKDEEIKGDAQKIYELRERKKGEWQIYLANCKFHFNQKPMRARDLNIFELLEETLLQIENRFFDNILFSSTNEILIYYDDVSLLNEINSIAKKNSLWVSVTWAKRPLIAIKTADPSKMEENISEHLYESLPEVISPPICEICQMRPAEKNWPSDYIAQFGEDAEVLVEGKESLCDTCFSIRGRQSKLRKLKDWENTYVAWIKLTLNYKLLNKVLGNLYRAYLKRTNITDDVEVRFSLVYEFQQDYNEFLEAFKNGLLELYSNDSIETILKDMFCLKIGKKSEIFNLLELLNRTFNSYFPEIKNLAEGSIKISIVSCNSEFPFFEVWRNIEQQNADLQNADLRISLIGHGKLETSLNYLDQILVAGKGRYRKSALHKLAEISKLSEKMAEIKFNDRSEKSDFESYEFLKRNLLPMGMDFQSILTFAKLIGN